MATSRSAASTRPRALGLRVLLSGVAIFVALALVEVSARVVYCQLVGKRAFAAVEGTIWLQQGLLRRRVAGELGDPFGVPAVYREARERLRMPVGAPIRAELERVYERWFDELVADVCVAGARLVVVDFLEGRSRPFGAFIAELVTGRDIASLDIANRIRALGVGDGRLQPGDGHLSRYANLRVAAALAEGLVPFAGHRSSDGYAGRPRIVADGYDAYPGDGRRQLVVAIDDPGEAVREDGFAERHQRLAARGELAGEAFDLGVARAFDRQGCRRGEVEGVTDEAIAERDAVAADLAGGHP